MYKQDLKVSCNVDDASAYMGQCSAGKLDRFFSSELKQVLCRYIFSQKIERYLEISETNNNYVDYNDHTYILAFFEIWSPRAASRTRS